MNKFFKLALSALTLSVIISTPMYANENCTLDEDTLDKISKIGFNKIFSQDPKLEIAEFFNKHTKYSTEHKLEKLDGLYSEGYINSDGFDKQTYLGMIKKTWDLYPVINYATTIKDITIDGSYAVVQVKETAIGETKDEFENIKEKGLIESNSYVFYFLQKQSKDWQITSSMVVSETTALKYGDAKNLNLSISSPSQVKEGEEYTALVSLDMPKQAFILASISNEPIVYPQKQPQEVFRNIKRDGVLERVFKANKKGYNEYAIASVGITKASVNDTKNININITGMAFLMSRVNVLKVKDSVSPDTKEATNTLNGKG